MMNLRQWQRRRSSSLNPSFDQWGGGAPTYNNRPRLLAQFATPPKPSAAPLRRALAPSEYGYALFLLAGGFFYVDIRMKIATSSNAAAALTTHKILNRFSMNRRNFEDDLPQRGQ